MRVKTSSETKQSQKVQIIMEISFEVEENSCPEVRKSQTIQNEVSRRFNYYINCGKKKIITVFASGFLNAQQAELTISID